MALKFTDEMLNKALDNVYGKNDALQKALDNVYGPQTKTAEANASAVSVNNDVVLPVQKTEEKAKMGLWDNVKGVAGAFGESLIEGARSGVENIYSAAQFGSIAENQMDDMQKRLQGVDITDPQQISDVMKESKQRAWVDSEYAQQVQKDIVQRSQRQGQRMADVQEKYQDVPLADKAIIGGQGVGNLVPSMAIGGLGGAGLGTAFFAANAYGGALGEAMSAGATLEQAGGYAAASAALETAVEAVFGGIPNLGGGVLNPEQLTKKYIKTAAGRLLVNKLSDITGEGIEEVASSIIEPFIKRAFYDKNAENATLGDMASAFGGGALVSAILGVANVRGEYRDIKADIRQEQAKTDVSAAENTDNAAEMVQTQENVDYKQQSADMQRAADNLQIVQELAEQGVAPQSDVEKLQSVVTGDNSPKADPKVVEKENARVAAIEESARQGIASAEDVEKVRRAAVENIRQSENKAVVTQKFGDEEINRIDELAQLKGYKVVYEADDSENAPNGYIKDGTIYINMAGNRPYFNVAVHEVLHGLRGNTAKWDKLEKAVFQLIGSDGDMTRFADAVAAKYTGNPDSVYYKSLLTDGKLDQTKVNEEIVANFVEEYLPRIAKNEDQLMEAIKKDRSFIDGLLDIIRGIKNNLAIKFAKSEKAMLDEAERNLVNLLRAENKGVSNNESNIRFSKKGGFIEQLIQARNGGLFRESHLMVSAKTPKLYEKFGLDTELPMLVTKKHALDITTPEDGIHDEFHGITDKQLKAAIKDISDPALIFESLSHPGRLVVVTSIVDDKKRPIILAIEPNAKGYVCTVENKSEERDTNLIASMYGRNNFMGFFVNNITNDNLLYHSKEKSRLLSNIPGVQFPSNIPRVDFNKNIQKFKQKVNGKKQSGNNTQKQKQNNVSTGTSQGKFSLKIKDKDSNGNRLSVEQQNYFKDSKVVDSTGNLMIVYHQTDADFTEFNNKSTGAGRYDHELPDGIFTKPNDNDIGLKGKKQMALYANVKNPLKFNDRQQAVNFWKKNIDGYADAVQRIDNLDVEYHKKYEEADLLDDELYKELRQKLIDKTITREEFKAGLEETQTKKILNEWTDKSNQRREKAKQLINDYIATSDYDGIILENDQGSFGRKVKSIIAFSSNQLKNISNVNPTENEDIRYSRQIESYPYDGESAKSRGIRKKAVDELADNLGRRFGITGKIGKEGMLKEAYRIADKVEKFGYITKADMDNFFDAAAQAARFTDEKADYAPLKKLIRETGIEPLNGREYLDFLQKYKGKVKFKRGGMPIDVLYQQLAEEYPEYINADITNPADQMWRLGKVYDSLRRKEMTVSEYYGDRAQDYINESYAEYAREVDLFVDRINSVSRYKKSNVDKKAAKDRAKGQPARTYTLQDVQNAYKNSSRIEKEITKLMADTALTDADKSLLDDLQKIKNPNVLAATLKDMQENNPNAKAIYKLFNLKQELAQVIEPVREYRKANKERNRREFMDLLTTSKSWREKHKFGGLRYKAETFERIIDDIVTDKKAAERLKDMLPRSIHRHVAEGNRYKNELRDRVRRLNLDNEKLYEVEFENKNEQLIQAELTESGLVQIYGEGLVTKEYLDKIGADVVKITEAAEEFRKIYNEMIEKINESYVRNGYKPIEYRKDYFPHFTEDGTDVLLNKMTSWFGIDAMSKIPASWQRALARVKVKSYTNDGMLPTEISGTTYKRSPGRKYNAHALQRIGENTVYDALKGFDNYLETAADVIFLTDDIQNLRSFEDTIRYKFSDKGIQDEIDSIDEMEELSPQEKWARKKEIYEDKQKNKYLNNFVGWLHNYTNLLAGKKDFSDRVWEENLGRGVYRLSKDMESRVAANMVAGNISSAMTNFIPIAQMTTQVNEKYVLAAMSDTVRNMGKSNDGFAFQSDFLTNRFGSEKLVDDSLAKKLEKTPGLGQLLGIMETVDEFTSNVVVRGRYMQNINEGMSHEAAMKDADEFAAGLMADRSKGALPTIFETKNPVAKAMTMFQVEQNNQLQYLLKDLPRSLGDRDEIGKVLMMALFKYSLYSWIYNWMYEQIAGRKPAFSPIDLISDTGRDFYRAAKGDMKKSEAVSNAVVRAAEELPFAAAPLGMLGISDDAGRLPISGALPDLSNVLKLLDSEIAIEKKKSILYKEMSKPMYYLLFPVAGGQVKKTGEALHQMAVNKGVSYYTSNKGEKNVQFVTDTSNPLKWVQSAAFGRWSTKEAREYVNNGFDYLSKSESRMYEYLKGIGIDSSKAYKQAAESKAEADSDGNGYLKTAEVVRYLDKTGMSKQDKANLFSIMLPNVKNNPYK